MSEKIVPLNQEVMKDQLKEMVRGSAEGALNELPEREAQNSCPVRAKLEPPGVPRQPLQPGQKLPVDLQVRIRICIDADGVGNIACLLVNDYDV